eukprot:3486899-Pleurochrysis_carterae.AAC.3
MALRHAICSEVRLSLPCPFRHFVAGQWLRSCDGPRTRWVPAKPPSVNRQGWQFPLEMLGLFLPAYGTRRLVLLK